ncbi:unnamed protein product, partial [Prorocentrum cordatum]
RASSPGGSRPPRSPGSRRAPGPPPAARQASRQGRRELPEPRAAAECGRAVSRPSCTATQKTKVGAPGALRPGSRAVQATGHEGRREVHPPESLLEERERGRTKRRGGGRQRDRKRCAGVRRRGRSCRRCSRWPPLRGHPRRGAPLRYSPRACG